MIIEPLKPEHSQAIIKLLRSGMREELIRLTPYACKGYGHFLKQILTFQYPYNDRIMIGAFHQGELAGFAEWLYTHDACHLNNIYTSQRVQRKGIGTRLYQEGLQRAMKEGVSTLSLDVFSWNLKAHSWYKKLGFKKREERFWLLGPLQMNLNKGKYAISNYPDGIACLKEYGFGKMIISTSQGVYPVLLLGDQYFKISNEAALLDNDFNAALHDIDSSREIIVFSSTKHISESYGLSLVSKSIRMEKSLAIEGSAFD
jgi:GNAT superfamily N-acetyltransferase